MSHFLDRFKMNQGGSSPDINPSDAGPVQPSAQGWGLLDMTLDGIVLLDDKGCVMDANGRALEFLHSSLAVVSGFDIWDVVSEEITQQHQEATQQALETCPPRFSKQLARVHLQKASSRLCRQFARSRFDATTAALA